MSSLTVYHENQPEQPLKLLTHAEDIASTLAEVGVRFERWEAAAPIAAGASQDEVIAAYAHEIERLKRERGYITMDVVSLNSDHPQKAELRAKFLDEHRHGEDEVRFFVAGRGLFVLHIEEHVYAVLCERNDLISCRPHPPLVRHGRAPAFRRRAPVQQPGGLGRPVHRRRHRQPLPPAGRLSEAPSHPSPSRAPGPAGGRFHPESA